MGLHTAIHLVVGEILPFVDEGLPYLIQCCIVEVLGLERRFVDDGEAWVCPVDHMLLNEAHHVHLQSRRSSCATAAGRAGSAGSASRRASWAAPAPGSSGTARPGSGTRPGCVLG